MTNELSENTKAILMLTHHFNRADRRACKPLSDNGYGYLAHWLKKNKFAPKDLLDSDRLAEFFDMFSDDVTHFHSNADLSPIMARLDKTVADITSERLTALLARGMALSQALEKWQSAGIWILSRSDEGYPKIIRKELGHKAPAILFGVGNVELLRRKGIGFVGSRNCGIDDENATIGYVDNVTTHGYQVVSGAAEGVDSIAMQRALNSGSTAIGILGDSLFAACGKAQWRQHLKNESLVLVSPFDPEAAFGRGQNAMQRNKYIYLLSEAVVAVCANVKGGTFEGVKENLKANWRPQYVSQHQSSNLDGNQEILAGFANTKPKVKAAAQAIALRPEQSIISLLNGDSNTEVSAEETLFNGKANIDNDHAGSISELVDKETGELFETPKVDSTIDQEEARLAPSGEADLLNQPAFKGLETLAAFYFDVSDAFTQSQREELTEAEITNYFNPLVLVIGKEALDKMISHLVEHGLLIKTSDVTTYRFDDRYAR
ncbi:DNA recombination-mediator A family protein [Vibrio sp. UCD-FRSSP16_10]|uniref:DNA-processing protein DprA n=1 Tax=unclassified Vibrio TaxID=2614977 RepID=UPI0007FBFA7E|nr:MULTISPECIES: DNA-processing protein DprA [unclassified Vibrio]OBT12032.1 DNA recombination-mediator A family protein [Vibrio sp. UCD-FRSSP16_30]OBT18185.1 DNA recombination-mediator A family protein [Vibrio sp. UCD-FRSSP16_10]